MVNSRNVSKRYLQKKELRSLLKRSWLPWRAAEAIQVKPVKAGAAAADRGPEVFQDVPMHLNGLER